MTGRCGSGQLVTDRRSASCAAACSHVLNHSGTPENEGGSVDSNPVPGIKASWIQEISMHHEVSKWIKLMNLALIKKSSLKQTIRRMIPLPLLLACAATLAAQTAPVSGTWKVVPSANGGNQPAGNILLATTALSTTDRWAGGAGPNPTQHLTPPIAPQ